MRDANAAANPRRQSRLPALRTFESLKHRNFRILWTTSVINAASNWIQQVTIGALAYDLTGSALIAALTFGMRSLPQLLIGPIGGVLGDTFSRKKGVQINTAYMAVLASGFALLIALGWLAAWHILLFSLLQGLGQSLVGPTRQALVANTVPREDLPNAIALNSLAQTSMRVIGPFLGGSIWVLTGPAVNFSVQGAAYVLTFLLMVPLKAPYTETTRRRSHVSLRESFGEGLVYVVRQRMLLGLMALALVPTLFTTPINLGLLPVFAKDALDASKFELGLLYSAQGVGAVIASFTLASLGNFRRKGLVVVTAATCLAVTITFYSQVTIFLVALPLLCLATCCFTTYSTINQTIIQTITPDEYRARVMGLHMMDHGLTPAGTFLFGTIAEFYGVSTAILIAGICAMATVTFINLRFPSIRAYRSGLVVEEVPAEPAGGRVREGVVAARSATTD